MKKKLVSMLLVGAMAVTLLAGCGGKKEDAAPDNSNQSTEESSEEEGAAEEETTEEAAGDFSYKVGLSNLADSDETCYVACETFKEVVESDEFAKAVGQNVTVEWTDSDGDITKQTTNVETMISKGIDALFLIGVDTAGNSSAVQACNAAGIPVFMVATESEEGDWKFVGFNEYDCGKVQGEYVVENAEEGDKICYIEGTPGREAVVLRNEGFMDAIKERDDLEVLSVQTGNFLAEDAMQVTEDWIQAYGDEIDWIVSQDNKMGQGVVEVLKAANMQDKVRVSSWISVGTWDAEYVENGDIEHTVYVGFDVLGQTMAEVCEKFYKGEEIGDQTYMELYSVTKDNYSEYFG